jgi:hypothetical protein
LSWLRIRCGPAAPDTDALTAAVGQGTGRPASVSPVESGHRYPSITPG